MSEYLTKMSDRNVSVRYAAQLVIVVSSELAVPPSQRYR
jgi:hypothetical protein